MGDAREGRRDRAAISVTYQLGDVLNDEQRGRGSEQRVVKRGGAKQEQVSSLSALLIPRPLQHRQTPTASAAAWAK